MPDQKSTAEIVPTNDLAIKQFNERLSSIIAESKIQIVDNATYIASGNAKISLDAYEKAVKNHFFADISKADEELKRLKNAQATLLTPATDAKRQLVEHQREYAAEEKRKADAETRRKQEEINRANADRIAQEKRDAEAAAGVAKKAKIAEIEAHFTEGRFGKREYARRLKEAGAEAEAAVATAAAVAEEEAAKPAPTVRVVSSVPSIAGARNQTYHYAEYQGEAAKLELVEAYGTACETEDTERADFLRRFITVNDGEVSKYAREVKNPQAVMSVLPGVKAWSKG